MPIFLEPSEARKGTRLPVKFIESATVLPGLEHYTGCDILISPLSIPLAKITDAIPAQKALEKLTSAGVLIQRKSGLDLVNSIPDLKSIQFRMLEWSHCGACWLLATGLGFGAGGAVVVDGAVVPNWNYTQVRAALRWWQLRGGHVEILPDDSAIPTWCSEMLDFLRQVGNVPAREVLPAQTLAKKYEDWVSTGAAFPAGIGISRRKALRDELENRSLRPTLANAMFLLTSNQMESIPGWGKKTVRGLKDWWGVGGIVRETGNFGEITVQFPDGLPFVASGDGIETRYGADGGMIVTVRDYNALHAFSEMVAAVKERES